MKKMTTETMKKTNGGHMYKCNSCSYKTMWRTTMGYHFLFNNHWRGCRVLW